MKDGNPPMIRMVPERLLLIGDVHRQVQSAVAQALPTTHITSVASIFEGIGELTANPYSAVLAAGEPIERRPEPAVRALRELTGKGRLILFSNPALEPLSRKMLKFGCDDYLISPCKPKDILQALQGASAHAPALSPPPGRPAAPAAPRPSPGQASKAERSPAQTPPAQASQIPAAASTSPLRQLAELPLADIFLESLLQNPHDGPGTALKAINLRIAPTLELRYTPITQKPWIPPTGKSLISQPIQIGGQEVGKLHLLTAAGGDPSIGRQVLSHAAHLFSKMAALQDRHNKLQKLAIVDDLTGLYNARYFRHFLTRLLERAKAQRFPITLLIFDIDDFKKYNDQYGHGVGDQILKQTARLMRRCCREHDLVARVGGDEFAVIFWDKDGPRLPFDPTRKTAGPSRPPQTPLQVFERFKRLLASNGEFQGLGASGVGRLSVSGGLAVYPYDAHDIHGLIKAADDYLMFKAKKAGKNSVYLVEGQEGKGKAEGQ